MKKKVASASILLFSIILFNCSKEKNGGCVSCDVDQVEICDNGDGTVSLKVEGNIEDTVELREDLSFEDAAELFCSEISIENCYECMGPNANDFDVCKEGEDIVVNGTIIEELRGASLEDVIAELEENTANEQVFENLSCQRK